LGIVQKLFRVSISNEGHGLKSKAKKRWTTMIEGDKCTCILNTNAF